MNASAHHKAVHDASTRTLGAAGLLSIALIHLLDLPGKFGETPYLAWMYIGLIVGALVVAAEMVRTGATRAWLAGAALATGALIGFTLTRTTGLPRAHGDIGNWTETLGLASLFVEGVFIALAGSVVAARGVFRRQAAGVTVPDRGPALTSPSR